MSRLNMAKSAWAFASAGVVCPLRTIRRHFFPEQRRPLGGFPGLPFGSFGVALGVDFTLGGGEQAQAQADLLGGEAGLGGLQVVEDQG